jgi:hypothetical protein
VIKSYQELWGCLRNQPFYRAFISSNFESARPNLLLKSHIASRISRTVGDVLALSACPKAKMLLFRRYPMILGSEGKHLNLESVEPTPVLPARIERKKTRIAKRPDRQRMAANPQGIPW